MPLKLRLLSWLRDARGVAAVEFAFIAPIMILLYFGMAELTMAMMAERRSNHLASMTADLVTQEKTTTLDQLDQVFTVGPAVLYPLTSTGLSLRLSSVKMGDDKVPRVVWSRGNGDKGGTGYKAHPVNYVVADFPKEDPKSSTPIPLLNPGETIIMAEVNYAYAPVSATIVAKTMNFSERFYLRPRRTAEITCSDCPKS